MFLAVSFKVVTVVLNFTLFGDLNIILEMRIIELNFLFHYPTAKN